MILIVEDDPRVAHVLMQMVSHLGYRSVHFGDAGSVLRFIDEGGLAGIRMVISDFRLPDGNGAQLIRHARSLLPELPSVIVSAYADAPLPERVDFIAKPFRLEQIQAVLTKYLAD